MNTGTNGAALSAEESAAFLEHVDLTPQARHALAVLFAHLRAIKGNSGVGGINQQLNQDAGAGADDQHNWINKTQAQINALLTNPVAPDQLAALREYFAASEAVRLHAANQHDFEIVAKAAA